MGKRLVTLLTVGATVLLAACTSVTPSSSARPTGSQSPAGSPSPGPTIVGDDPGTWSPVRIGPDANGTTVELVVGQAANLVGMPDQILLQSSDPNVVEVSQPEDKGTYQTVGGLRARSVGEAEITVTSGDKQVLKFKVVVKPYQKGTSG